MPRWDYKIKYTDHGRKTLGNCARYLVEEVGQNGNPQAALHFWKEVKWVNEHLKTGAESYAYLENSKLREKEFRKIHFKQMNYKAVFHVIDDTVFVDAVFHDSQDYEGILIG